MKLTNTTIERAIRKSDPGGKNLHEHPDCIRFAFEWLDAQTQIKNARSATMPLKHVIEAWAGRYVSQSDVELAAELHPNIWGSYPYYNFSKKLVEPSTKRLEGLSQAFQHKQYLENTDIVSYDSQEDANLG